METTKKYLGIKRRRKGPSVSEATRRLIERRRKLASDPSSKQEYAVVSPDGAQSSSGQCTLSVRVCPRAYSRHETTDGSYKGQEWKDAYGC